MGVGYTNIDDILSGHLAGGLLLGLCVMKLVSWSISLGSGTSDGTLAPLFTKKPASVPDATSLPC